MVATTLPGSIWRDKKTGKYKLLVPVPSLDGRRRRSESTHSSREEAIRRQKAIYLDAALRKSAPRSVQTLAQYSTWWIDNHMRDRIREGTLGDYQYRLKRWVLPRFGARKLRDIRSDDVAQWMTELRKSGLSIATINGARTVFHQVMRHAAESGHIDRNPVQLTRAFRAQRGERTQVCEAWSLNEAQELLGKLEGEELEFFIKLCLFTGVRRGEATALTWSDIDVDTHTVSVTKTQKTVYSQLDGVWRSRSTVQDAKTNASVRTVGLHESLVPALIRHRDMQERARVAAGDRWTDTGLVFASSVGTAVSFSNLRRQYAETLDRLGLRYIRIHDLRHTTATLALAAGQPIEAVGQVLGHSDINLTKRTYAPHVAALSVRFATELGNSLSGVSDQVLDLDSGLHRLTRDDQMIDVSK